MMIRLPGGRRGSGVQLMLLVAVAVAAVVTGAITYFSGGITGLIWLVGVVARVISGTR